MKNGNSTVRFIVSPSKLFEQAGKAMMEGFTKSLLGYPVVMVDELMESKAQVLDHSRRIYCEGDSFICVLYGVL